MNFFSHAAVASWTAPPAGDRDGGVEPGVVLGAMLPDFATMCDGRIEGAREASVTRGIALHHATDAVFHQLPVVTGLMRELDGQLARGGCALGPRRAVAHVGVELLLDSVLVGEPAYRTAYLAGLAHDAELTWRAADAAPRFASLIERLRAYGVPDDLQRPETIPARLHQILAHRPLLAPSPHDMDVIRGAVIGFAPRVAVAAETILRGTRAGLPGLAGLAGLAGPPVSAPS